MEQKMKENIEKKFVFCIESRKTYVIKSIQKSNFRNLSLEKNTYIFYFSLFFYFDLFIKHDKTDSVSE